MKRQKPSKKKSDKSVKPSKDSSKNLKSQTSLSQIDWKIWLLLGVVVFLIFAVLINVFINVNANVITGFDSQEDPNKVGTDTNTGIAKVENTQWDTVLKDIAGTSEVNPTFAVILRGIFGRPVKIQSETAQTTALSAIVLTICVWLLVLLTFSNILSSFSSFSKGISWGIAAVFATIMAQFNWQMKAMLFLARFTGIVGGTLTFIGILSAFFGFFVINVGIIGPLGQWARRRNTNVQKVRIQDSAEKIAALKVADLKIAKAMADEEKKSEN
jgi:hypothetical protein